MRTKPYDSNGTGLYPQFTGEGDYFCQTRGGQRPSIELLGVNFRTAPIEVRESLSFNPQAIETFGHKLKEKLPECGLLILSTCNRTEFYFVSPDRGSDGDRLLDLLIEFRPEAKILRSECYRYQCSGEEAIKHLMKVASGLDSQILGDQQILGQLKLARAVAGRSGMLRLDLEKIVQRALQVGKRARNESAIGKGAASIGAAIRQTIEHYEHGKSGERRPSRILLLGAGEMAKDVGRHLGKSGKREMFIMSRRLEKAKSLGRDIGAHALPWHDLMRQLRRSDFVISATSSLKPVITKSMVSFLSQEMRPKLVIDAGVPRNIAMNCGLPTLTIDSLRERQEEAVASRRQSIPVVEGIIEQELNHWRTWIARQPVEDYIRSLYERSMAAYVGPATPLNRLMRKRMPPEQRRFLSFSARRLRAMPLDQAVAAISGRLGDVCLV